MPVNCCVFGCPTISNKNRGLTFHGFPKDPTVRKAWAIKIRHGKPVTPYAKVCSLHFKEDDFDTPQKLEGITRNRFLKKGVLPSMNLPLASFTTPVRDTGRGARLAARASQLSAATGADMQDNASCLMEHSSGLAVTMKNVSNGNGEPSESLSSAESASGVSSAGSHHGSASSSSSSNMTSASTMCSHRLKKCQTLFSVCLMNHKQLVHFTGFSHKQFEALWMFVTSREGFQPCQDRVINVKDQLLFTGTLMKMRMNMFYQTLAYSVGIGLHFASTVFNRWVDNMYLAFKEVNFWSMYEKSENEYDIVIDCTEIPVQQSGDPVKAQATYSTYKSGHTLKALVGVSESGAALYCSCLYGGATSDRQMVSLSGFLNEVKQGMFILADKGFLISDLLEDKGVTLNIPPTRKSRKEQMSELEVATTRAIANRRIVVEQVIGKAKNYAILTDTMPIHLWPLSDKISYVIFHFVNFKKKAV